MSSLVETWRRLPRRGQQAVVIGLGAIVVVLILQQVVGSGDARFVADSFLSSHPEIEARIGPVSRVRNVGRRNFSWSPGTTLATFDLEAVGERGSLRAEVKAEKEPNGGWEVYSATLFTKQGPMSLLSRN